MSAEQWVWTVWSVVNFILTLGVDYLAFKLWRYAHARWMQLVVLCVPLGVALSQFRTIDALVRHTYSRKEIIVATTVVLAGLVTLAWWAVRHARKARMFTERVSHLTDATHTGGNAHDQHTE